MYLGMQSIKYMCISLCNKQQWQFSECFQYNLVIVVLNTHIIIPPSSELMFYLFWSLRHVAIDPLQLLDYSENFIFPHFFQFLVGTFYYVLNVFYELCLA